MLEISIEKLSDGSYKWHSERGELLCAYGAEATWGEAWHHACTHIYLDCEQTRNPYTQGTSECIGWRLGYQHFLTGPAISISEHVFKQPFIEGYLSAHADTYCECWNFDDRPGEKYPFHSVKFADLATH